MFIEHSPFNRWSGQYDSFSLAIYSEFAMFGLLNPGVQGAQDDAYRRVCGEPVMSPHRLFRIPMVKTVPLRSSRPLLHHRRHRCGLGVARLEDRTLLATFVVSSTNDGGHGSLRQAILDSDSATGQTNNIDFNIPGSGVQSIAPLSALPAITQSVLIDGFSQPGYAGTPLIELSGSQAGGGDGLTITGPDVTVRGLNINGFSQGAGIHVTGTGATGDWIYGNFLGTDPTGTQAVPNNIGVEIDAGATRNLVGTNGDGVNDASERNLLSGNLFAGVWITGQGITSYAYGTETDGNIVAGNFIGTRRHRDSFARHRLATASCSPRVPLRTGSGSTRRVVKRFMTRAISFPGTAPMAFRCPAARVLTSSPGTRSGRMSRGRRSRQLVQRR